MKVLLGLAGGLPQFLPPIVRNRPTLAQSMLWFALDGPYTVQDLVGRRDFRDFLYTLKDALDNYLQYGFSGGLCPCALTRGVYCNSYTYQPDHQDGGLPWVYT